jgi:hypothetical protein
VTLFTGKVPIIGEAAKSWLMDGRGGKVLAVVNHATYLVTEDGELFWLATAESSKHRRSILWPTPLPNPMIDSTYTTRDGSIILEAGLKMDLGTSVVWKARVIPVQEVVEPDRMLDNLFTALGIFLNQEAPSGFGFFIRPVLQMLRKKEIDPSVTMGDVLVKSAWPVVERIASACLRRDPAEILKDAEALIGLGDGLTPAGDDFLGGLFFSRFLLECVYPYKHFWDSADLPGWVDGHRSCTNQISYTLLRDNASGHALEPLSRFGSALLTNLPLKNVTSAASDLIKVGHSTGWSLLAGFVTGMLLVTPN